MGGGQANSGQAATAAAQQTAANTQDMQISAANAARQQQLTNGLFGTGAAGSTGTLSGFLNPANLTQTGLSPAYSTQFNQGSNQIGQNYAQQRGALAQSFANSGATGNSTPNGFQADQMRQLGSSAADSRGQLYSGLIGQQHTDALNNFWNASNIASGNAASAGGTATQSAGNSGTSSAQIYQTAGTPTPGALNSAIGAAGAVGGGLASNAKLATCPCAGSMILMADGSEKPVELLAPGEVIRGVEDETCTVESAIPSEETAFAIFTSDGCIVSASCSHTLITPGGGFVIAFESIGRTIQTKHGFGRIVDLKYLGKRTVYDILTDGNHSYQAGGIWAWGVRNAIADAYLSRPEIVEKLFSLES